VLLRGTSGFLAVPRAVADPTASLFDRIAIMPPSVPPSAANASAIQPGAHRAPPAVAQEASEIAQQQSPIAPPEPADETPNGAIDEPRAVIIGGTVSSTEIAERQATFNSRHMLEVANPRDFKMPSRPVGAVTTPPAGGVPPVIGAAVPGVITPPAPQPARVPRQPPTE
jgi:hypothetical protein